MGKARIFSDDSRDAVYQTEFDNELYNTASQQNSYNLGSVQFSDQSGIGNFNQSGRDQRNAALKGALFRGNIGFDLQTVELDVGTNTINLNEDSSAVVLPVISTDRFVTLSAGTTADLITITGAQRPGQRLRLYNTLTNTITIKHTASATVNTIRTPDAGDLIFLPDASVDLTFDITTAQWRVVGNLGTGGGGTAYATIQDEGIPLTQRTTMNFIGANVVAVDNAGQSRTDITISGAGSQTPWISDIDAAGFSLNNLLALDIEDSGGATKLNISGPLGVGARFAFVAGDTVFFTENITDILSIDAGGLNLLTNDITMGSGGNIVGGGAGEGMTNVGHFDFVDNLATPVAAISIFNDGTFLQANTNSVTGNIFITPAAEDLNMVGNAILDVDYIESAIALLPGSGFIRMGTAEEIRMRNPANTDDLIITSGSDAAINQSLIFKVASGNQLTISEFDLDVIDNDIINTGDILPGAGAHEVGDSTDFYNQMHSQFFVPEAAAIITNRYSLAKTGNTLYVNYDNTNADAGFGVYEEGFQQFLFSTPLGTTREFFIGTDPFTGGETYRIQMGENSGSSAKIEFTEGLNDLIIDRQGAATTRSILLRTGGVTRFSTNSTESEFFSDVNISSEDITNVGDVFADVSGTSTFGQFQPSNGGFDYILRSRMSWEQDPATYIEMDAGGIDVVSDDGILIGAVGGSSIYSALTNHQFFANSINVLNLQDNAVISLVDVIVGSNFAQYTEIATPTTPVANQAKMYAKDISGTTTPVWLDSTGTETSMLGGGGSSDTISAGDSKVQVIDTGTGSIAFFVDNLVTAKANIFASGFNFTSLDLNIFANEINNAGNLSFTLGGTAVLTTEAGLYSDGTNLISQVPTGDGFTWKIGANQEFGIGVSTINFSNNKGINAIDPTAAQDVATKAYVDSVSGAGGVQDIELNTTHETAEFDHQLWTSHAKQGDKDQDQSSPVFGTVPTDAIYFYPFYIGKAVTISRIGVEVGILNADQMSVAIYDNNGAQNYPRNRLASVNNQTMNTTGIYSIFIDEDVTPGLYWIATWFDGGNTSTIRGFPLQSCNSVGWATSGDNTGSLTPVTAYVESGFTSSIMPATAPDEMSVYDINILPAAFALLL